jgi:hypothetical protein
MARSKRPISQRTIVKLERSAHILTRFHEELRAMPASSRSARLIERNEKERAKIAESLGELRLQVDTQRPLDVK